MRAGRPRLRTAHEFTRASTSKRVGDFLSSATTDSEVATYHEISAGTGRRYEKILLERRTPPRDFDGLRAPHRRQIRAQGPRLLHDHP
jgi:hypothetical protein